MDQGDTSTEPATPEAVGAGLLDLRPARWALIYGLPAITCLLAGSAIYVSRLGVEQDVHLLTQERWLAGGRAAIRIVAYDRDGQLQEQLHAELSLAGQGREPQPLDDQGVRGLPALDFEVEVPSWPEGDYHLICRVTTPSGVETIEVDLRLSDEAGPEAELFRPRPPPDRRGTVAKATIAETTIELLPRGAGLVPNLSNLLFLRTTDEQGRPLSTDVDLSLISGLREPPPASIRTNDMGVAVLSVYPDSNEVVIEVGLEDEAPSSTEADAGGVDGGVGDADAEVEPEARTKTVFVPTTPAQVVMRAHELMPETDRPFEVQLTSLHSSRPVYLDAYVNGRWVASRTEMFRGGRASVRLDRLPAGGALVQAYTATLSVGYGYAAHHLYLREPGQDDEAVLVAIAEELRRRELERAYVEALLERRTLSTQSNVDLAAAFLLSRLDTGYYRPPLRVASSQERSAELEELQQTFKLRISIAIAIVGLLVAGLLTYAFTLAAWKARAQRQMLETDLGSDEQDLYVTSMGRPVGLDRFRVVMQIALMVGVVAAGFFLLAVLVSALDW